MSFHHWPIIFSYYNVLIWKHQVHSKIYTLYPQWLSYCDLTEPGLFVLHPTLHFVFCLKSKWDRNISFSPLLPFGTRHCFVCFGWMQKVIGLSMVTWLAGYLAKQDESDDCFYGRPFAPLWFQSSGITHTTHLAKNILVHERERRDSLDSSVCKSLSVTEQNNALIKLPPLFVCVCSRVCLKMKRDGERWERLKISNSHLWFQSKFFWFTKFRKLNLIHIANCSFLFKLLLYTNYDSGRT